jgi:hypothetical protein
MVTNLAMLNYEMVRAEYGAKPVRPVIDGEPRYELHPQLGSPQADVWQDHHVRNSAYQAVFSGAAGHTYGHASVWNLFSPDRVDLMPGFSALRWEEALNAPGAVQMNHLKALVLSKPYFTREPDDLLVGDPGSGEGHIAACRDSEGSYAMAYLPFGQSVRVDLSRLAGEDAEVAWFNPRSGDTTVLPSRVSTKEDIEFRPPTSGVGFDWVLILTAADRGHSQHERPAH